MDSPQVLDSIENDELLAYIYLESRLANAVAAAVYWKCRAKVAEGCLASRGLQPPPVEHDRP